MSHNLIQAPYLLLEAELQPLQGHRFQPTGFPDVGAGEFFDPRGQTQLLVESAQSMANRLETAVWDAIAQRPMNALDGMPYVRLQHSDLGLITSLTEAHRLASPYLMPHIADRLRAELPPGDGQLSPHHIAPTLLKYDPCSLLHGVFFPSLRTAAVRVTRLLAAFIEASGVSTAVSGGVKLDLADPSGPAKEGKGHVPFARREYCAERIVAYFNLDLLQLQSLGLSPAAQAFLQDLALLKIRRFLQTGLRLRTACHFRVAALNATEPPSFAFPEETQLQERLQQAIATLRASGEFATPAVWDLTG